VTYSLLHWAHVLVTGYWLGSELVINALAHYVARATSLSGTECMGLRDFLLDVDQHVRNALILSMPLGFSLGAMMGRVPLGAQLFAIGALGRSSRISGSSDGAARDGGPVRAANDEDCPPPRFAAYAMSAGPEVSGGSRWHESRSFRA
jgi:hypothetical protein